MSFKEYVNSIRGKSEPVSTPRSSFADYVNNIKFQQAQQQAQQQAEDLWKYATDYTLDSNNKKWGAIPGAQKYRVNFNPVALEGTKDVPEGTRFVTQEQLDAINAARKEITDYYATQVNPEKPTIEKYTPKINVDLSSFMPRVGPNQTSPSKTIGSKWDLPERFVSQGRPQETVNFSDPNSIKKLFEAGMPHTTYKRDGQVFHNNIALKNHVKAQRIVEAQDFITHQTDFNELANKFGNLKADSSFGNTNEVAIHNVINGYKEVGQSSAFYKYKLLDDTQKGVYNYLVAKSKDAAQEYLKDIDGTLEDRKAEAIAENLDENIFLGDIARGGLLAATNLQQGFTDAAMAGTMLPNGKVDPRMREAAFKTTNAERLSNAILEGEDNALAKIIFDATSTISRQALPLIAGAISGSAGYTAIMGAQVTAQSMKEAAQSNKPIESGFVYGVMQTGLEIGLERLFGGIAAKVGGGTSNKFVSKMMSKIDDKVTNKLLSEYLKYVVSLTETASGESVQELSQALIDPMVRNIVYNENNTYSIETLKDAFYQAFIGFLSGGVMGVPSVKASVTNTQFERIGENSNPKTVLELCEETGFTSSEDYVSVKKAVESGKQVDPLTLGRLSVEATQNVYNPERLTVEYLKAVANLGTVNQIAELMFNGNIEEATILKEKFGGNNQPSVMGTKVTEYNPNAVTLQPETKSTLYQPALRSSPTRAGRLTEYVDPEHTTQQGSGISNLSAANGEKDAVTKSVEKVTGHMDLTADQKELRRIGSQFGAKVEFADLDHYITDKNGNKVLDSPNGRFDPNTNTITLNTSNKVKHDPVEFILKHEMTHSFEINEEAYAFFSNEVLQSDVFKDYVKNQKGFASVDAWSKNIIDRYDKAGHPLGEDGTEKALGAQHEMIADFVGDMLFGGKTKITEDLMNAMSPKARRSFIEWVKDFWAELKRIFAGKPELVTIEQLEKDFLELARKVEKQNSMQTTKTEQSGSNRNQNVAENEKTTTDEGGGKKTTTETTPVVKENVEKVNVAADKNAEGEPKFPEWVDNEVSNYMASIAEEKATNQRSPKPSNVGIKRYAAMKPKKNLSGKPNVLYQGAKVVDGKQYVTYNGYFVVELNTPDESIPSNEQLNTSAILQSFDKNKDYDVYGKYVLDARDISLIKKQLKDISKNSFVIVGDSYFNIGYVDAVLKAIENPSAELRIMPNGYKQLLIEGINGKAIIMPSVLNNLKDFHFVYKAKEISENSIQLSLPETNVDGKGNESYSLPNVNLAKLTETQYNNFGWVRANDVLTPAEYSALMSNYTGHKHNDDYFPVTRFGETVVHSSQHNNVLMYVKGSIRRPQITKVVKINEENTYILNIIKEELLRLERAQAVLPFSFIRDVYGEKVLAEYRLRDYAPFQEIQRGRKGRVSEENHRSDNTLQVGKRGSAEDSKIDGVKYSLPAIDSAYFEAVERGDMDTAQRMVDEAAKEAGYIVKAYHGTGSDFNIFSEEKISGRNVWGKGFYFGTSKSIADDYASFRATKGGKYRIVNAALKMDNPFIPHKSTLGTAEEILDTWFSDMWKNSRTLGIGYIQGKLDNSPLDLLQFIAEHNNIEIKDVLQKYGFDSVKDGGELVVFDNNQIKSADPVTYDDNGNVIPLSQRFNAENEDIRYSLPESVDFDSLIDSVSRGEMSAEEAKRLSKSNKLLNPVEIANTPKSEASTTPKLDEPKMQGEGDGESKLHGSLDRSAIITDEVKEKIKADTYIKNYGTTTNKETLAKAMQRLDEGGAKEVYWWEKTLKPDEANAVNVAEGLILLQRYQDAGDTYGAIAVAEKLREIASASGQTVQIFSVIGRFTPEMMVAYSQHELDKAFKIMQEGRTKAWVEANAEKFQLTEEEKQAIYDKTLLASSLEDGSRVKAIILGEITTMLQNKLPPEKGQALRAWMRISLLFNAKTQFRNILGNASMILPYISSDFFGGLIDAAIAKKTGVRTTGFDAKTFGKSLVQGGKKGALETIDDYKRRIHTKAEELNRFETNAGSGKSFNENHQKLVALNKISKVLNEVDRLNSMFLEMGDRPFFEAWFMNSLENQMRLNKVSEPTLQMVEMAKQEALQRTWQDDNKYTKAASGLKRALNTVQVGGYGLGDIVLKFVKTPSNIFKAMIELSPVGFGSAALKIRDMKIAMDKGEFTPAMQKEVVRSLSNAITGTAIYLLVYALAASGAIDFSGGGDEDKDVSNFEKYILGIPPYSFKFLGMDVTYTWNQPIGTVLAVVSDIMEDAEDGDINEWDAISTVGTVFTSQSFLSNLYEFFSKDDPLTGVVSAAFSEPSAAIPTLLSQMASVTDPYRRTSYDPSNPIKSAINDIIYRIPFLRTTLPKQVNVLGQEAKNPQFANIYKAFISPSTHYPKADMSVMDVSTEVYALYQATSDKTVMPRVAPNKVTIKGKDVTFSVDEKADFQRRTGELSVEILREMFALPEYDKLTDEEKTEAVSKVYNYVSDKAKSELDIYDYETLSAMEGTRTNGEPVLKRSTYDRMDDKAKQMLVDDYFFSKDERNCKGDPKKLAKLFVKKAKD